MNTLELRNIITDRLSHIDDVSFLKALKTIVDTKVHDDTYHLSNIQKKRIDLGRTQFNKRKTISHNGINKEIEKWLDTK